MSKYHNKVVFWNGQQFDSRKERDRYAELLLLQRAGIIKTLRRQVKFQLIPNQYVDGKLAERSLSYIADFVYVENDKTIVEDVKGIKTDVYKIKRKLMLQVYGIQIRET